MTCQKPDSNADFEDGCPELVDDPKGLDNPLNVGAHQGDGCRILQVHGRERGRVPVDLGNEATSDAGDEPVGVMPVNGSR